MTYQLNCRLPLETKKKLFFDSEWDEFDRIVVFTTEKNLKHFNFSKIVICDGTFKSCPINFEQLFAIQRNIGTKNFFTY